MKRTLAVLLVLAVLACALGMAALAEDGNEVAEVGSTKYESLSEALTNATGDNTTVTLLKDIELSEAVTVSKSVTIAGDGKKITRAAENTGTFFTVTDSATLTLDNVHIDAGGKWSLNQENWNKDYELSYGSNIAVYGKDGWRTDNGAADPITKDTGNVVTTANLITINGDGGLVLDGGTVIENIYADTNIHVIGWGTANSGTANKIEIKNATIRHFAGTGGSLIAANGRLVDITLDNGATLSDNFNRGDNGGLFYLSSGGSKLTMKAGAKVTDNKVANCNGSFIMTYAYGATEPATFTMEGGEIRGNIGLKGSDNNYCQPVYAHRNGVFIMNGGTITENTGCYVGAVYQRIDNLEGEHTSAKVELNGGEIYDNHYYGEAEGVLDESTFGQIFITDDAKIGAGMTITGDVSFYGQAKATVEGTITGNVHIFAEQRSTYKRENNVELKGTITGNVIVENGAKATNNGDIQGNVTVEPQDATDSNHSNGTFTNNGTIGGTVTLEPDTSIQLGEETVSVGSDTESSAEFSVSGNTVTMNKGTVKASGSGITFQNADGKPLEVGQDGTVVVPVAQISTTTYGTLKAAVEAATAGDTIELLSDIELGSEVSINKALTIQGAEDITVTRTSGHTGTFFAVSGANVTLTLSGVNIDAGGTWTLDQEKYDAALEESMAGISASDTASIIITKDAVVTTDHLITLAEGASLDVKGGSKITNFYTPRDNHIIQITSGAGSVSLTDCVISHGASANQFIVNDGDKTVMNTITIGEGCVIEDNFVYGNGGLFLVGYETTLVIEGDAKIIKNTTVGNGSVAMVYDYAGSGKENKMFMYGGEISGNVGIYTGANHYGSPIYVHKHGEFTMTGGSITENIGGFVGAIMENEQATKVEITGGIIKDNHYAPSVPADMANLGYPSAGMGEIFIGAPATFGPNAVIDGDLYVGFGGQLENNGTINVDTYVYASKSKDTGAVAHFENKGTVNGTLTAQNGATVNNSGTVDELVVNNESEKNNDYKSTDGKITNAGTGTITGTVTLTGGASVQLDDSKEDPASVTAGANGAKFTVSGSTVTLTEGTLDAANCDDINFRDTANNELEPADGDGNGEVMIIVARVTHGSGFSEGFDNFADAVAEAARLSENGGTYTVTLLKDAEGGGINIGPSGSGNTTSVIIDFGGHTYTLTNPPVGSGDEYMTQGIRPLAGSTVTLKNGTLAVNEDNGTFDKNFIWLIHNYGNLTVEDMTLDGSNLNKNGATAATTYYTLHSECGTVTVTNTKFIDSTNTGKAYSIGCNYWDDYPNGTQITIDDLSVFTNVNLTRNDADSNYTDGHKSSVTFGEKEYYITYGTDEGPDGTEFTKDGDTLTPKLPDSNLNYSAIADTSIVDTCAPQTMWVLFKEPLPANTWLWFEITDANKTVYGIAGKAEEGTTKMAWSFLNQEQFENWPADVDGVADGEATVKCYVLPGKTTTEPETKYLAWEETVNVSNVTAYVPDPDVIVGENIAPQDVDTVTEAAKNAAIDDAHMNDLASEALTDAEKENEIPTTEKATEELGNIVKDGDTVHVVVETYLQVEVTGYTASGDSKQLTFEIKPMYQIVATTVDNVKDIELDGDEPNAVKIGGAHPLTVPANTSVTMTLGVPDNFIEDTDTIYVKHVKDNGRTYYYRVTNNNDDTITFTNPHGFSTFTVIVTAPEFKAEIGDTLYETLKDAVDHVQNGETIVVTDDCSEENVTVGRSVSFSVTVSGDGTVGTITAGSGYSMTSSVSGTTTTYTVTYSGGGSVSGSSTYTVSTEEAENAEVELSTEKATAGDSVTVTVTPAENFHVSGVTVTGADGKEITVVDNGDGTFTFTMPSGGVTVKAETFKCPSVEYTDIDVTEWYHDYVDYAITHDLMDGFGDGVFAPEKTVTRAQMAGILWNLEGQPVVNYLMTFTDVPDGKWYTEAIRWAASEGIISGFGDNTFKPEDIITREQMAAMLYFYEEYKNGDHAVDAELTFTDSGEVSSWANEAVVWCVGKDLIHGKGDNAFDPRGTSIRAQLATLLALYDQMDK